MRKLDPITNLLLFCSGVSKDLILKCPNFEIIKYSSIGFTILLTCILAFVSSFFALSLIFENSLYIILGSFFWSAVIFNLDRYIVISLRTTNSILNNFFVSLPRFLIALLVAVVISKPIEIKLFEKEIDNFFNDKRKSMTYELSNTFELKTSKIELNKQKIISVYNKRKVLVDQYMEDYLCEAAGTCGTKIRGRGLQYESRKQRWESENKILIREEIKKDSLLNLEKFKEEKLRKEYLMEKNNIVNTTYGFFDKVKALSEVNYIASNFILLIFIMIEIAPMLTKLLTKKGPYDSLVLKAENEYENEYLNSSDSLRISRSKNEKIKLMDAEMDLKMKERGMKNISRQEAFERYEKLKNNMKNED